MIRTVAEWLTLLTMALALTLAWLGWLRIRRALLASGRSAESFATESLRGASARTDTRVSATTGAVIRALARALTFGSGRRRSELR
jgi:type VI protein secretion system component VasK